MRAVAAIAATVLLLAVLVDAFYTIVLGRRAERALRITGLFYRFTWPAWAAVAKRIRTSRNREDYLCLYGPGSLIALLGIWAACVVFAFGVLQWSAGLRTIYGPADLGDAIYYSGTTLFAVGSPDARNTLSRFLNVVEAGMGISFLGLTISYLPVLYQAYSDRESRVVMLDARAGSPPSACELLRRQGRGAERVESELREWEEWAAKLIQNHLSYPMLSYFRSQHMNQSWLVSLVAVLDSSAYLAVASRDDVQRQAELTFAMARHVVVDLARVFRTPPEAPVQDRLPPADFERLLQSVYPHVAQLSELNRRREMYEPYANALGGYFLIGLPAWLARGEKRDNWEATDWNAIAPKTGVSDPYAR